MHDESGGEPAEYLLATARAHEFRVSRTQLARWHRGGLLPRPTQRGLGRGRGTESVYPAGTAKLLLALLRVRKGERRLSRIAWHLWWAGHDVLTDQIRAYLERLAAEWERRLKRLMQDGALTEAGLKFVDQTAARRIGDKGYQRIRRRVGRRRMPTFMRIAIEVVSGVFEDWADPDEPEIVGRGLGVPHVGALPDHLRWVEEAADQRELSRLVHPGAVRKALAETTDEDLIQARNQLRVLLGSSTIISLGLGAAQDLDAMHPWGQVALLLVWLVFRSKLEVAKPQRRGRGGRS